MGELETYLLSIPHDSVLLLLGGLMFLTCLGFVPNNTDLTVLTAGMMSGFGHFVLWQVLLICLVGYFLGEGFMFALGKLIGHKAQHWRVYQKIMGGGRKEKILEKINHRPIGFFVGLRLTPILRPFVILSLGAIGVKTNTFSRYHLPITFIYTILLGVMSFLFASFVKTYMSDYKYYLMATIGVFWVILLRYFIGNNDARSI